MRAACPRAVALGVCSCCWPAARTATCRPRRTAVRGRTASRRGAAPVPPPTHPGLTLAAVGDIMPGTDFPENMLPDDDGLSFFDAVTPILSAPDVDLRQFRGRAAGRRRAGEAVQGQAHLLPVPHADALRDVSQARRLRRHEPGEQPRARFRRGRALVEHGGAGRGRHPAFRTRGHHGELGRERPAHRAGGLRAERRLELAQRSRRSRRHWWRTSPRDTTSSSCRSTAAPKAMAPRSCRSRARSSPARIAATWSSSRRSMIDAGADLVLGHGPHVVRPMEIYRDRLIAYSLGNFATYYGISVEGIRGIAPILLAHAR